MRQGKTSIEQSNSPFKANTNENLQLNNNEILTSPASTGIYYVDCTSGSDTNDGSQTSPYKTIGKAVTTINTGVLNEYTVNISPGTYAENNILIKKNITFTKNPYKSGEVIINGNLGQIFYTPSFNVLYNINFNSLTLTNGNASYGSVIQLYKGNLKITNCKIHDNFEIDGAIYLTTGNLTVTESEFTNNYANYGGGAINHNNGETFISNSKLINNTANYGGAIYTSEGITCIDTLFSNNRAIGNYADGGAILTSGNIILTNTKLINNSANDGGAIYITNGNITCNYNIFINNSAPGVSYNDEAFKGRGGAIYLSKSNLYCNRTKFINNNAMDGGAICTSNGVNITCINTTFINNSALGLKLNSTGIVGGTGGAITIFRGIVMCVGSNFNNNIAITGGAIYLGASNITCTNSNFSNNSANKSGIIHINDGNIFCNNTLFTNNNGQAINAFECYIDIVNTKFTNNNATAIYSYNSNINSLINSFINNTPSDNNSIIFERNGDVTCNYCVFFNNNVKDNTVITIRNGTCNLDYNWWGSNVPTCNVTINKTLFNLINTVYMSVLPTIINDKVNSEYTINVILNQYLDSTGNLHNLGKTLPFILVNLNANGGYLSSSNGYLNENNKFSTKYICPSTSGTYSISVNIDNETLTIPIKITGGINPGIYGENLTMIYGTHQNYTGKLIGNDGKPIIGQHVALKLSNSQGQSKTYYATTDTNGEYQLEINLYPGAYSAIASYDTYSCTNYIKVFKKSGNLTNTILTANDFKEPYGTDANFTGKLMDNNIKALIGQHIALKLSNSQGQSKTYYATTDVNGEYQLAINLYPGNYIAECTYAGTSVYDSSITVAAIIVTS